MDSKQLAMSRQVDIDHWSHESPGRCQLLQRGRKEILYFHVEFSAILMGWFPGWNNTERSLILIRPK